MTHDRLLHCDLHLLAINLTCRRWLREELTDHDTVARIRRHLDQREAVRRSATGQRRRPTMNRR